jgi:hypothetical protein
VNALIWAALPIPAWRLREGDRVIDFDDDATEAAVLCITKVPGDRLNIELDSGRTHEVGAHDDVTITAPSHPIDGYALWRDPTGAQSVLGCSCLYRRGAKPSDPWESVGDDLKCRWHNPVDEG